MTTPSINMDDEAKRYLNHANIPRVHWDAQLSNIPETFEYKDVLKNICDNPQSFADGGMLYLFGDFGSGKSANAAIILKAALRKQMPKCYWITHRQLAQAALENTAFDAETTVIERCQKVDLLAIDELSLDGREKSAWTIDILEDLVRRRVDFNRATIITSNYAPKDVTTLAPSLRGILDAFDQVWVRGKNFRRDKTK